MKFAKHIVVVSGLLLSFAASTLCQADERLKQTDTLPGYVPKDGFVPDERTAIAVAIAVLTPIYGDEEVQSKFPFIATFKNGKWTVKGTLSSNLVGGVPEVQISKASGTILKVSSSK
jgi:hypothetical protein